MHTEKYEGLHEKSLLNVSDENESGSRRTDFVKLSIINFHDNSSSDSRIFFRISTDRQMCGRSEGNFPSFSGFKV
jgi:hypothetical protein